MNVRLELSINAPPVVRNGMRVEVSEETARVVDVALVVVEFNPVKFWRVEEADERKPPVKNERPETEMAVEEA